MTRQKCYAFHGSLPLHDPECAAETEAEPLANEVPA